mmetsp:Transcript_14802/g.35933  ORF Transcript_14802/g.35933 Transcript_14802/m.35933 type:complete len:280 (+) Transcript_14802:1319-2158(+)
MGYEMNYTQADMEVIRMCFLIDVLHRRAISRGVGTTRRTGYFASGNVAPKWTGRKCEGAGSALPNHPSGKRARQLGDRKRKHSSPSDELHTRKSAKAAEFATLAGHSTDCDVFADDDPYESSIRGRNRGGRGRGRGRARGLGRGRAGRRTQAPVNVEDQARAQAVRKDLMDAVKQFRRAREVFKKSTPGGYESTFYAQESARQRLLVQAEARITAKVQERKELGEQKWLQTIREAKPALLQVYLTPAMSALHHAHTTAERTLAYGSRSSDDDSPHTVVG